MRKFNNVTKRNLYATSHSIDDDFPALGVTNRVRPIVDNNGNEKCDNNGHQLYNG
jgi:hypothetical protein